MKRCCSGLSGFFDTGVVPVTPQETIEIFTFMEAASVSKARRRRAGDDERGLRESQPRSTGDIEEVLEFSYLDFASGRFRPLCVLG